MIDRRTARRALLHMVTPLAGALPRPAERRERPLILVLRPDHLGDLLLATPALAELRRIRPDAEVGLLVGPWAGPVFQRSPDVDRVLTYPFPWFDRQPLPPVAQRFLAAGGLATWLRTLDVAEAIVLRPDHWWGAMATALARIPTRVGYGHPELRPLLTRALPPPGREHAVVSALRLVGAAPAILAAGPGVPPTRFTVGCRPEGDVLAGRFAGKPYAVVHPGASSPMKRWPANRWAAVADALADRGLPVVLAAGPGEGTEIDAIRRAARRSHAVFAPAPSLDRLAALLAGARLALGVDSAPMHLATAVGTPTVRIFGPGDETLYGPWGDPGDHRVVRAPGTRPDPSWFGLTGGSHATLLAVTVDQVLAGLPAR